MISIKGRQGYSRANFGALPLNQDGDEIDMCTLNLNYVILSMSFIFPQAYCCRLWCERGLHGHQHICPVPMESRLENTWHIKKSHTTFIAIQRDLSWICQKQFAKCAREPCLVKTYVFFVLLLFVVFAWLRLMPMGHFSKSPMMVGRIKYCWENLLIFKSNSWVQENRFLHFWKERKEILCYSTTIWYNLCYPTALWYITRLFSICIGTHFFMGIFGTWNRLTPVGKLLVEL